MVKISKKRRMDEAFTKIAFFLSSFQDGLLDSLTLVEGLHNLEKRVIESRRNLAEDEEVRKIT